MATSCSFGIGPRNASSRVDRAWNHRATHRPQVHPATRRARCGPFHIAPAKARIAFLARVRFAGVSAVSERGMTVAFAMPGPVRFGRFTKVEEIVPGWWGHWLRITEVDQLDAQLQGWLRRSYQMMGLQERLARRGRA